MTDKFIEMDERIIAIARRLFAQSGIVNIEMKDICAEVGCSRSTLYRHFASKESILFRITEESVLHIMDTAIIPRRMSFETGYEAISWQLRTQMNYMLNNVDEITFMRDFDFYYSKIIPGSRQVQEYEQAIMTTRGRDAILESLKRGVEDGSIRPIADLNLAIYTLINSCIGLAQRVLPRESIFRQEMGYSRELIEQLVEYLLLALKAN